MAAVTNVRPSPIAGTWYSGDQEILGKQIDSFIAEASLPEIKGRVIGLITPHAGYRYSGKTAGYSYRSVQGKDYGLVAILSPFHSFFPAQLLTSAHDAYRTPLGDVCIDKNAQDVVVKTLRKDGLEMETIANDQEHSLEIQLPFLQRVLISDFELLPIMLRTHDYGDTQKVANALVKAVKDKDTLLVASTDLSHFYPKQVAESLDAEMLHCVESFSPEKVLQAEVEGKAFACGASAVAVVLGAAKQLGADHIQVLHYSTSADSTGDESSVVGYGAVVITKAE
ncbi:MAG TPA: AmmeMemoRadiSam system protein B [Anaerolineae bacterium]|nr:AmmeMemoRadiSam system protein B [Anaerolineae bacterium]